MCAKSHVEGHRSHDFIKSVLYLCPRCVRAGRNPLSACRADVEALASHLEKGFGVWGSQNQTDTSKSCFAFSS